MSIWLSAANRVANTGRGVMMAAAKRQQTAATKEAASFWTRALRGKARRKGK